MKLFWYKPINYSKELVTAAIESGATGVYVAPEHVVDVKRLAKVMVISSSKDADLEIGKGVAEILIDSKQREAEVEKHNGRIPVIIRNKEWTIIPLENLISKTTNLIQTVRTHEEVKVALETLEKGADGVLLETDDVSEIKKTWEVVRTIAGNEHLTLHTAEIVSVKPVGMGTRVCVDTTSILAPGVGLLCGDSSSAFFLVYNENVESPYCDPRPFRVNAGAVHAYVRVPGEKTKYLGELKTGDSVVVCDELGNTRTVVVGRAKIEERPMVLVEARVKEQGVGNREQGTMTLIMQNAETIRLTKPDGSPVSVTQLKEGDDVLVYCEKEKVGRHFGVKVEETITEK